MICLRFDSQEIAVDLDNEIDRQIARLLADDDESGRCRGIGVIFEGDRDMARIATEFEVADPLGFEVARAT